MASNRVAIVAVGLGCMVAAAGGGYLAMRQNTVPTPAAAIAPLPAPVATPGTAPAPTPLSRPVQAIEPQAVNRTPKTPAVPVSKIAKAPVLTYDETPVRAPGARRGSVPVPAPTALPPSFFDRAPTQTAAAAQSGAALPVPPPLPPPATTDATITTAPRQEPRQEERVVPELPRAPEPPQKTLQELVVSANSVIGLQTETRISSDTAKVEDRVEARVTRDVKVGDMVAIPAGSRAIGSVTKAERGGKFKERASLGIRFHTLVLPDGTRVPISTETIFREGESPSNGSSAKIGGGAVGGAILGAILGGAKGAAIGAAAGAGGGAAVTAAGDRSAAALPAGTPMTVRILSPVTLTVER
jgi:hypothetical protein